jgi:hypothetical protein
MAVLRATDPAGSAGGVSCVLLAVGENCQATRSMIVAFACPPPSHIV